VQVVARDHAARHARELFENGHDPRLDFENIVSPLQAIEVRKHFPVADPDRHRVCTSSAIAGRSCGRSFSFGHSESLVRRMNTRSSSGQRS
jgi:hypothetical protein